MGTLSDLLNAAFGLELTFHRKINTMPISYSQNLEDVMLWRALKHVKYGTYIDVGANHPEEDSVTNLFYQLGWSGINIEPMEEWFHELVKQRKRDINLPVAISSGSGPIVLYEFPSTGLTTSVSEIRTLVESSTGRKAHEVNVMTKTLNQVVHENGLTEIHFLKVDVEGAEADVLMSLDFTRTRPWIVVVESMRPNVQMSTHKEWESLLTESKYNFVYADGLNRFYVADEHSDLVAAFNYPPNVFDGYETHTLVRLRECDATLSATLQDLRIIKRSIAWHLIYPLFLIEVSLRRILRQKGYPSKSA